MKYWLEGLPIKWDPSKGCPRSLLIFFFPSRGCECHSIFLGGGGISYDFMRDSFTLSKIFWIIFLAPFLQKLRLKWVVLLQCTTPLLRMQCWSTGTSTSLRPPFLGWVDKSSTKPSSLLGCRERQNKNACLGISHFEKFGHKHAEEEECWPLQHRKPLYIWETWPQSD